MFVGAFAMCQVECAEDAPQVRGSAGRACLVAAWHLLVISVSHIPFTVCLLSGKLLETCKNAVMWSGAASSPNRISTASKLWYRCGRLIPVQRRGTLPALPLCWPFTTFAPMLLHPCSLIGKFS